jgi:hypothetical protein
VSTLNIPANIPGAYSIALAEAAAPLSGYENSPVRRALRPSAGVSFAQPGGINIAFSSFSGQNQGGVAVFDASYNARRKWYATFRYRPEFRRSQMGSGPQA